MKKCSITNGYNSWVLEVDGKTFYFTGYDFAEHLKELYTRLGYEVFYDPYLPDFGPM